MRRREAEQPAEHVLTSPNTSAGEFLHELELAWPESWAVESTISVAGLTIAIRYARSELHDFFSPALDHVTVADTGAPDLTIEVADGGTASISQPALFTPGGHSLATKERIGLFFQYDRILNIYDPSRNLARLWVEDRSSLLPNERGNPFRHLLGWFLADHSRQLVHAGAIGLDGKGMLLVGRGGSGKSTTALACLNDGFDFVAEDYTALEGTTAHTLYSTARIDQRHSERHPELLPSNVRRQTVENKQMAFLADAYKKQLVPSLSIGAIVKPQVIEERTSLIQPLPAASAVVYLAPSTIFQVPGHSEQVLATVASLARRVPSYSVSLGSDLSSIPRALRQLLDSLA